MPVAPRRRIATRPAISMSKGKILVVDDEGEVQQLLSDFLEDLGYEVIRAADGLDALAAAERERPDLVLLDVAMPGLDGIETLKRLVVRHPGLPVIMATANADVATTSRLLAIGAADYVPKPFDLEYLHQAVSVQVGAARER
jgi:CheY-like chemotaxis protein